MFDLGGLQNELEQLLGIPVEVWTAPDLLLKFRSQVLWEAQPMRVKSPAKLFVSHPNFTFSRRMGGNSQFRNRKL